MQISNDNKGLLKFTLSVRTKELRSQLTIAHKEYGGNVRFELLHGLLFLRPCHQWVRDSDKYVYSKLITVGCDITEIGLIETRHHLDFTSEQVEKLLQMLSTNQNEYIPMSFLW